MISSHSMKTFVKLKMDFECTEDEATHHFQEVKNDLIADIFGVARCLSPFLRFFLIVCRSVHFILFLDLGTSAPSLFFPTNFERLIKTKPLLYTYTKILLTVAPHFPINEWMTENLQ